LAKISYFPSLVLKMRSAAHEMNKAPNRGEMREERLKRALMVCGAIILFILGVWLLVEPAAASSKNDALRWTVAINR
jgi:hypothetical protein